MDDFACYSGLKTCVDCYRVSMLRLSVRHVCRCDRSLWCSVIDSRLDDGSVPKNDPGKIWVLWETPEVRSAEKDKLLSIVMKKKKSN